MSNDLLSQDEIDALLGGVEKGSVPTGGDTPMPREGVTLYDFTQQDRVVHGRLPALDMVNDRFARFFRLGLFNVLRKNCTVVAQPIKMVKYADYVNSLTVPSNLNLLRVKPLRGIGLVVFEPRLIFTVIDHFFGGGRRFHNRVEGREFTMTETRVIQIMLQRFFESMTEAWEAVIDLEFEHLNSEVNPQFATIVNPSETVVVCRFHVEVDEVGGEAHFVLPYSMIEPIRELLDVGAHNDRDDRDERWMASFHEEVKDAEVTLSTLLVEAELSLREFLQLRPGDVIPIQMPDLCTVFAEDVPVFRGRFGQAEGHNAMRFESYVGRRERRLAGAFTSEKKSS